MQCVCVVLMACAKWAGLGKLGEGAELVASLSENLTLSSIDVGPPELLRLVRSASCGRIAASRQLIESRNRGTNATL